MAKNTLTMITGADLLAEVERVKALDEEDGVAEVLVCVPRVYRADTGETVLATGGVGGISAKVNYSPGLINILEVRGIAPFAVPVANIQNDLGETAVAAP